MSRHGVAAQLQRKSGTPVVPVSDKLVWQASVTLSSASTLAVALAGPSDSAAIGDLFMMFVWSRSTVATPAGWTLAKAASVAGAGGSAGITQYLYCFSRIIAAGDISANFTFTQATTGRMGFVSARYRNASGLSGTPTVVASTSASTPQKTDGTSMAMSPITPTALGQKVVTVLSRILSQNNNTETLVPPSGYTVRSAGGDTVGYRNGLADKMADTLTAQSGDWTTNTTGENAFVTMSLLLDVV